MTPRQVGYYRLDRLLGAGVGIGEVYRAYDTHRDRYVALKLLPEAFSGDPEYLNRFRREVNVAARLSQPHVIPIHDFGEVNGQLFIDMLLVDGTDIGALLAANGRIAPERAVFLASQVAEALDAAHADHLVHRDIKPSNILITSSDFVYVVDWGTAPSMEGRQAAPTATGTTRYMAPERFAGHEVDGRADIYSLACVLYECLTGVPPFGDADDLPALADAQLYTAPAPASSLVEGVPPALDAVLARGMAKDPEDRYPAAGALAAAAREALLTEAPAPLPPPPPMTPVMEPPPPVMEPPPPVMEPSPPVMEPSPPVMEPSPPMTELPPPVMELPPPMTELPAPTWAEPPDPTWQAATGVDAVQSVVNPPGPPAADRLAMRFSDRPTQTGAVYSFDDWVSEPPAENMPQVTNPDPGSGGLPPAMAAGGAAPGPAWRRLSVLILVAAAALAFTITLVLTASHRPKAGGASAAPHTGGATAAGTTGASSSPPSLAVPTVAGKIAVGQSPSFIQVAPNGKFAYIADPGAGAITVLNTANDRVSGTVKIPQGPPQFVSFSPDSRTAYVSVYTTNGTVHLIAFIDTASGSVTSTVPVDNRTPGPSATGPDGRYLYVPNHNMVMSGANENIVDVVDTVGKKVTARIAVPPNPHWVVFGKDGRFYTSDHMSATVTVLNAQTNRIVGEISVGETPHGEALSPDGSRLAVTSFNGNVVYLIDTAIGKQIAQIPVGRNPLDIAYSPDGRYLFTADNEDNTVTVIETADNRVIAEIPTGKAPTSITVLPGGHQAYVTDEGDGTVEILNIAK